MTEELTKKITPESVLKRYEGIKEPYKVECLGKEWWICPGVMDPTKSYVSQMFAEAVRELTPRKGLVLDIGCGCGIDAIFAAEKIKDVFAYDINPWAVMCTKLNSNLSKSYGKVYTGASDLFNEVIDHKVNAIYFNLPFGFPIKPYSHIETPKGGIQHAIFDEDYELMKRFLKEAKDHLSTEGFILTTAGTISGSDYVLENHAQKNGYIKKIIREEEKDDEIFRIYELRKRE